MPLNIRFPADHITDVSFVVQWDAVPNRSVDRYLVTWTDGTNPIQIVTVNETSCSVTNLTPNTTYTVTVAAVNKNCSGPFSTDERVTTNMSLSTDTAYINPTATTITTNFVTMNLTVTSVTNIRPTVNATNPAGKFIKL